MVLTETQTFRSQINVTGPRPKNLWQSIYDEEYTWRKDSLFNKWFWENWTAICKRLQIRTFPHTIYKNKLKWT